MAVGDLYRDLQNIRSTGTEPIVFDIMQIPGSVGPGSYLYRLIELPLNTPLPNPDLSPVECREVDAYGVELPGPILLTPIAPEDPLTADEFVIKKGTNDSDDTYRFGYIRFSQFDAGRRFKVLYYGRGSLVFASDVTDVCHGYSLLPSAILPGHISDVATDDFTFPADVYIDGDLHLQGVITKDVSVYLDTTDEFLRLNSEFTTGAPTLDGGLVISRGDEPNAALQWTESNGTWDIIGGGLRVPSVNMYFNHNQTIDMVIERVTDQSAEDVKVPSAVDGQVIYRTDTKMEKIFDSSLGAFKNTGPSISRYGEVATAGQTIFTLPWTFNPGTAQLFVYLNGMLQTIGVLNDYVETDSSTITFNNGIDADSVLSFINFGI